MSVQGGGHSDLLECCVSERARERSRVQIPLGLVSYVRELGLYPVHNIMEVFYGSWKYFMGYQLLCSREILASSASRSTAKQPLDLSLRGRVSGSLC